MAIRSARRFHQSKTKLILTGGAGREFLHCDLHVEIVSLEESQLRAPRALLQRVGGRVDRLVVLPHTERLVRHHHAHLLHTSENTEKIQDMRFRFAWRRDADSVSAKRIGLINRYTMQRQAEEERSGQQVAGNAEFPRSRRPPVQAIPVARDAQSANACSSFESFPHLTCLLPTLAFWHFSRIVKRRARGETASFFQQPTSGNRRCAHDCIAFRCLSVISHVQRKPRTWLRSSLCAVFWISRFRRRARFSIERWGQL